MCGIAGRIAEAPLAPERWDRVLDALRHRGPDDSGVYAGRGATLAHTRLSFLDASERGRQPMADPTGRWVLVFNGEVYNYLEIREVLVREGVRFKSESDTEVVLQAFIRWGEDCLDRFNGMFALAVWDETERRLFVARDRLGIKPFYYAVYGERFYFASEIKALLALDLPAPQINIAALSYFLQFRHNDLPETIFRGIHKLAPGFKGWWKNSALRLARWWSPPPVDGPRRSSKPEEVRELLADSVRLRLRSDFPTGLFLSGGVDSSGLLAAMADQTAGTHTFTVGMDGLTATGHAAELARAFGNPHHGVDVDVAAVSLWPRIVRHYDELCADPASLPMYILAKEARRHVKSVFSGEGADELFGGYERIAILAGAWKAARAVPGPLLRALPAVLRRVPPRWGDRLFRYYSILVPEGIDRLQMFLDRLASPRDSYLAVQSILMPEEASALLLPEHVRTAERAAAEAIDPWLTRPPGPDALAEILRFELANRLVTDLLLKSDAVTMAHGLECRVPWLDHRLVEYALALPVADNVGWTANKKVLRAAVAPSLPRRVARSPKENFFVPIHHWLAALEPWMRELLDERRIRSQGIFRPGGVRALLDRFRAGRLYYARPLWNLMHFQMWHEIYIENGGAMPGEVDPAG